MRACVWRGGLGRRPSVHHPSRPAGGEWNTMLDGRETDGRVRFERHSARAARRGFAVEDDEIAAEAGRYRFARRAGSHRARRRARNDPVDAERDDDAAREPRAMENSFPRRTPSEIESRERAEETATTTHLAA